MFYNSVHTIDPDKYQTMPKHSLLKILQFESTNIFTVFNCLNFIALFMGFCFLILFPLMIMSNEFGRRRFGALKHIAQMHSIWKSRGVLGVLAKFFLGGWVLGVVRKYRGPLFHVLMYLYVTISRTLPPPPSTPPCASMSHCYLWPWPLKDPGFYGRLPIQFSAPPRPWPMGGHD